MGKKLQDRFSFLKEKFYKFISAIPKVGNKDFIVEFHCIKCGKDIRCSTASYSNLRRHINIMHSSMIKEYDYQWARNKIKGKHWHQDDGESEGKSTPGKQSNIGENVLESMDTYSLVIASKKLPNDIGIPQLENLIKNKDPDVSFRHNKYTNSKLGKLKKYMHYVVHKKYHQEKGRQGVLGGRPSQFVYCRVCHKVIKEEGVNDHACVKAISGIANIYESDKSRVKIVGEETVNAIHLFIHPVKLDNQLTDLAYCEKCKSFFPKEIVMKSNYNHICLGSDGWATREKNFEKFKSGNLKTIHYSNTLGNARLRSYQCKLCKKIFKSAEPAEIHMRNEHGEGEKRVLCSHCGEGFETLLRAQRHEISHHGRKCDEEVPPKKMEYQCPECGRKFNGKALLKKHLFRIHSNAARSCICEQCGKGFKSEEALKNHIKTHGEKTVQCDLCELTFRDKTDLKKHRMRHTGERPNVCPYCQHGFIQISDCKKHILKVHGIVVPKGMSMKVFCDSLSTNPDQYEQPRRAKTE